MEYTYLNKEQQIEILQQRLLRYEAEHYNHEVNRQIGFGLANNKFASADHREEAEQMIAEAEVAQSLITTAHGHVAAELAALQNNSTPKPKK